MAFGVTNEGFVRKRLDDILSSLRGRFTTEFGKLTPAEDPEVGDGSVLGLISGVVAEDLDELWQLAEAVYQSLFPSSSNGVNLDNSAELVGIERLAATKSTVDLTVSGDFGTTILEGSIVSREDDQTVRFVTTQDVTIPESAREDTVTIESARADTLYRVTINGTDFDYTSSGGDTVSDIAAALVIAINGGAEPVTASDQGSGVFTVTADAVASPHTIAVSMSTPKELLITVLAVLNSTLYTININGTDNDFTSDSDATQNEITAGLTSAINTGSESGNVTATNNVDGTLTVLEDSIGSITSSSVSANLDSTDVTPVTDDLITTDETTVHSETVPAESETAGDVAAPAGTLTVIGTATTGWDAVTNPAAATRGREIETDTEFRLRRRESLQIAGAGPVEAIRSTLRQDVDDVLDAFVVENDEDTVDADGRPGHSFEAIVDGGDDQDIGDTIWANKAAGIQPVSTARTLVSIDTVSGGATYRVVVNGTNHDYVAGGGDTKNDIAVGIKDAVNAGPENVTAEVVTGDRVNIEPDDHAETFSVAIGAVSSSLLSVETFRVQTTVVDSQGGSHLIPFSRPEDIDIFVDVTVQRHPEKSSPSDLEDQVRDVIDDIGGALGIGEDVVPEAFVGPIFNIGGLYDVQVEISLDGVTFAPDPISISFAQRAKFDGQSVTQTLVTVNPAP